MVRTRQPTARSRRACLNRRAIGALSSQARAASEWPGELARGHCRVLAEERQDSRCLPACRLAEAIRGRRFNPVPPPTRGFSRREVNLDTHRLNGFRNPRRPKADSAQRRQRRRISCIASRRSSATAARLGAAVDGHESFELAADELLLALVELDLAL